MTTSSPAPERESRPDDPVIEVEDATVQFEMDRGVARVLDRVDLTVRRHEIFGIVGESGSGKSMLASSMLDAVEDPGVLSGSITYHPEAGTSVDVLDLSAEELRQVRWEQIAMVFQGALDSFNPTLNVRQHFHETLSAHDVDREEGMTRARELLSELYLDPEHVLNSYPHELSGGMKQRALIALSLLLEPELLVMDEPTAALDLLMQRSILALVKKLQREYDLTVVFISHDLTLVANLADRIGVMYAFDVVEYGPAEDVIENARHPYTRALLKAVPNLSTPFEEMKPIEGEAPDPVNVPSGCSYAPRCPLADDLCRSDDPSYHELTEEHHAACFHTDEAPEAVPLDFDATAGGGSSGAGRGDDSVGNREAPDDGAGRVTESEETVVTLEEVEVHFENRRGLRDVLEEPEVVRAVDGVSVSIPENDVVAVIGESGCGKTTLGKTAIGLQRPTGGTVSFRGQDVWDAKDGEGEVEIPYEEIRRSLQIIHQDPGSSLNPNQTVMATLLQPLKRWHPDLATREKEARVFGMLSEVGMTPADDYAYRYPHQLSGGEQQRVALIRALLMEPDLILADEAVSALDVSLRVDMMDLMLDLQDRFDTSFLFISHNLSNARYFAGRADGRIAIMYLGEVVEVGPYDEVLADPKHPYTQVLKWATPDLEARRGEIEDPPVHEIDVPDPVNPPSGCRFHTRCPEAREYCAENVPKLEGEGRQVACFRADPEHPYWDSDPLERDREAGEGEDQSAERDGGNDDPGTVGENA